MPLSPHPLESVLRAAGLRPTRQRVMLLELLRGLEAGNFAADHLARRALEAGGRLSQATVYNILNQFAKAGLVRRVDLGERAWFSTGDDGHHHFLDVTTGRLSDIPGAQPVVQGLPLPPEGYEVEGVDILVRIRPGGTRE